MSPILRVEDMETLGPCIVFWAKISMQHIHSNCQMDLEDWMQEAWMLYPRAAQNYLVEGSAVFHTYFVRCVRNRFRNIVRDSHRHNKETLYVTSNDIIERNKPITLAPDTEAAMWDEFTPTEADYIRMLSEDGRHGHQLRHRGDIRRRMQMSSFKEKRMRRSIMQKLLATA